MRIDNSNILLGSQRSYQETNEDRTEFRFWMNPSRDTTSDSVNISANAKNLQKTNGTETQDDPLDPEMDFETSLKKLIAELLTGQKIRILRVDRKSDTGNGVPVENKDPKQPGDSSEGWGLDYKEEHAHREKEDVDFTARGIIRTADGKEISFSLWLEMSREAVESDSLRIRAGDALKDPLVINLNGSAAQLTTDKSFAFDIDSDGNDENLPGLGQGRGYLALDLNSDGMINNGNELFGPKSGNGFHELAAYDTDGNQWIDENDEVFNRLSVLSMDEKGITSLRSLYSLGIGAVYLPNRSTSFDLKDQSGSELLGKVKASGIFIRNDGTVGTVQQIDLKA